MVTKAIVRSVNGAGNRCIVRMPLFENASSTAPVEAEALVSITPGVFNNVFAGDVVFVAFEENALEKPIIIGKLFTNASNESKTNGGAGVLDSLKVRSSATIPSSTIYEFPDRVKNTYKDLQTPKKVADYIRWLEDRVRKLTSQLDDNFRCFKNWTQWQLKPENVEIDDGDIDANDYKYVEPCLYQNEGGDCSLCDKKCTKNKKRVYSNIDVDKTYPKT